LTATDLARLRGRIAEAEGDLAQADVHYATGAASPTAEPYARGRVLLAHGQLLRRRGRHADAVERLRRARAEFAVLGALPDVHLCDEELDACGERAATRADDHAGLTAAELSVAHLVTAGLSNKEAAARLYVSAKAVEYHLGHIYAKLGITSRRQLADRLSAGRGESSPIARS
jgi:DNA-binding CsgD family transcriptional regulator